MGASGVLDATLAETSRLTIDDASLLEAETADALMREAYAVRGKTLASFAARLGVGPEELAAAIVARMPEKPTRTQLTRLMSYVVPELRAVTVHAQSN
jgi:hypothetical protein